MSLLAALVLASWLLTFWRAGTRPDNTAGGPLTLVAVFSSVALALWALLGG